MWWHKSITFPIDKSNNKEVATRCDWWTFFLRTARLFTATSGDSNHKLSRGLTPVDARRTGPNLSPLRRVCECCGTLAQSKNQLCYFQVRCLQRPSFSLTCLPLGALVDTLQDDTGLLRQRHELATMEIQGADEHILIRPGSSTAQGSEGAADAFHRVY